MSRSSLLDGQSTDRCAVVLVDAGSNEDNVDGDPFEYAQLGVAHVRALVKQLSQQLRLGLHPCQSNDCALHDAEYDDHDHDDDTREGVEWTAEASTAQTATTSSPPRSGCTALLLPPVGQQTSAAVHLCAVLTFFAVAVTPSVGPFWPLAVSIAPAQAPKVASSSSSVSSFSSSFSSPLSSSLESAREVSVSSSLPIPSQLPSAMISTESPTRNPTPTPTPMAPGEQASSINPAIELPATQSAEFPLKSPAVQQLIAAMPARFVFDASTAREALTTIRAAVLHSESVSNLRDCAASLTFLPLQPPNFQVGTPLHLPVQLADMDVARLCAALPSMHGVCILHHSCRTVRAFDPALAYLMSTSGSTGTPKVVLVPSTAIATNVSELAATLPGGADDRMLAVAPPTFDPFIIEIALACIRDATLVIPAYSIRRNPQKLARLISEGGIHWLQCTPSLLAQLSQQERLAILDSSLRTLILGGEPFPAWLLRFLFTNQERLYSSLSVWNIYGTTECSVWSTAFQLDVSILSQGLLDAFEHSLPIGNPLPQSCIELRDLQDSSLVLCHICGSAVHHSRIATLAERDGSSTLCGQLWLGGPARGCRLLSEAESELSQHGMRDSGDQAEAVFDESAPSTFPRILFRGRRDRTIKRFGQRVSLDAIESWLRSLHVLQSFQTVALVYDDPFLTLVLSTGLERQQSAASLTDDFNARALLSHIALVAPQPAMAPDRLHVLRAPCALTPSGKVDMIALKRLIDKDTQSDCPKNAPTSREALCQALEAACPHRINELHHAFVHSTACRWLDAGLSSFDLVRLAAAVSDLFATVDKAAVLESMFHGTFEDLCRELMPTLPTNVLQRGQKRSLDESPPSSIRVPRLESSNSRRIGVACGCVYSRASKSRVNPACRHAPLDGPASAWTFDFSKCIDASPLVLLSNQKPFVAIGSHDHHFALIELQSGNLCWKTLLPDRIESSACLSPDGTLLVVGDYSGALSAMDINDGAVLWQHRAGDAIKPSPCVDSVSNTVWFGSHDKSLRCVDCSTGSLIWQTSFGSSWFSSPAIDSARRVVVAADLGGRVVAVRLPAARLSSPAEHEVLWKYDCAAAVFSSPCFSDDGALVVVCTTDGRILTLLASCGLLVSSVTVPAAIFSSAVISSVASAQAIFVGSHDGLLNCVDARTGRFLWQRGLSLTSLGSPVYSSPALFEVNSCQFVAAAATDGTVCIFRADSGQLVHSTAVGGMCFSSPVVHDRRLLVGSRDNKLYCLVLPHLPV